MSALLSKPLRIFAARWAVLMVTAGCGPGPTEPDVQATDAVSGPDAAAEVDSSAGTDTAAEVDGSAGTDTAAEVDSPTAIDAALDSEDAAEVDTTVEPDSPTATDTTATDTTADSQASADSLDASQPEPDADPPFDAPASPDTAKPACVDGGPAACDDDNACTIDKCNPLVGCVFLAAPASSACDDGDACTQGDACEAGQCQPGISVCQCKTASDCQKFEDGDLCNGTLYCNKTAGVPYTCQVNPATQVSCPTVNNSACQKNLCVPATGQCKLILAPANSICDDGDSCTTGDYCDSGLCLSGTNTCNCKKDSDCAPFEDGNLCNGTLFCNKAKAQCQLNPSTVVQCQTVDDSSCRHNVCNPKEGKCYLVDVKEGTACDDGNPCTPNEGCAKGECSSAVNSCECQKDADCLSKDDGNLCNGTLYCDLQVKKCRTNPVTVVSCNTDDDSACLRDTCDPKTGKCSEIALPKDGTVCDDGNPCTALSLCGGGQCKGQANLCECQLDADCTAKEDGDLCNGALFCDPKTGHCEVNPATIIQCPGAFDEACLTNQCDPKTGSCGMKSAHQGNQCDDGSICSAGGWCLQGSCEVTVKQACECTQDADCAKLEDGDLCNGTLYCAKSSGAAGGAKPICKLNAATPVVCKTVDDTACSKAICQPKTGQCAATAVNGPCEDGKVCTHKDACSNGNCAGLAQECADGIACSADSCQEPFGCVHLPGPASICDDANPCTQDSCDLQIGCKTSAVAGSCDDGDACTKQDACKSGNCLGLGVSCDDGNPCTSDLCSSGQCGHLAGPGACSDGDPCTAGDSCLNGQCGAGKKVSCDDKNPCTVDGCVALSGQCTSVMDPAAACSDGNACTTDQCDPKLGCGYGLASGSCSDASSCTTGEFCTGGACGGGKLISCDDANPCTLDGCSPQSGCTHAPLDIPCDDGNVCTSADQCTGGTCAGKLSCDDANSCTADACDFAKQGCVHLAIGASCSDDNTCTQGDLCAAGQCQPGALQLCDDGNPCLADDCHPKTGCFHFAKAGPCTVGKSCSVLDTCSAGKCSAGPPRLFADKLMASSAEPAGLAALADGTVLVGSMTTKLTVRRLNAAGAVLGSQTQSDLPTFKDVSKMKRLPDGRVLQAASYGGSVYLMRFGKDGKRDLLGSQLLQANVTGETLRHVGWRNLGGQIQYLSCGGVKVSYLRSQLGVFDETGKYLTKFEYASSSGHNECSAVEALDDTGRVAMLSSTTADGIGARLQVLDSAFKVVYNLVVDSGDAYPSAVALAVRANGSMVFAGARDKGGAGFPTAWWTVQVNAGGTKPAWEYKQDNSNPVFATDIVLLEDGSTAVVGWFYADRPDMKRFDPAGKWLSGYGSKNMGSFNEVSVSPDGDLWLSNSGGGHHALWRMSPFGQVGCTNNCANLRMGDCDDDEPCTFAYCSVSTCGQAVSTMPCDDGNACATSETCSSGSCKSTSSKNCSDNNPCTADTCNPATGCVHQALVDGLACGVGKTCLGGACL